MTATCEEGGSNSATFGYYGIEPGTWAVEGGTQYAPTAGGATQAEQIAVEMKFQHYPPDPGSCRGGY